MEETDALVIILPVMGGMLVILLVGAVALFTMARKKRSLYGTYNPQKAEYRAPRIEMNEMFKMPPEERLI